MTDTLNLERLALCLANVLRDRKGLPPSYSQTAFSVDEWYDAMALANASQVEQNTAQVIRTERESTREGHGRMAVGGSLPQIFNGKSPGEHYSRHIEGLSEENRRVYAIAFDQGIEWQKEQRREIPDNDVDYREALRRIANGDEDPMDIAHMALHHGTPLKREVVDGEIPHGTPFNWSVVFEECSVGHGHLRGTNWLRQKGCVYCEIGELRNALRYVKDRCGVRSDVVERALALTT